MKVDEVIKSAISRAAVVRVQNALNPLLWVSAIAAPICWIAAYMFRDDPILKYGFAGLGALPIVAALVAYFLIFSSIGTAFSPKNSFSKSARSS